MTKIKTYHEKSSISPFVKLCVCNSTYIPLQVKTVTLSKSAPPLWISTELLLTMTAKSPEGDVHGTQGLSNQEEEGMWGLRSPLHLPTFDWLGLTDFVDEWPQLCRKRPQGKVSLSYDCLHASTICQSFDTSYKIGGGPASLLAASTMGLAQMSASMSFEKQPLYPRWSPEAGFTNDFTQRYVGKG